MNKKEIEVLEQELFAGTRAGEPSSALEQRILNGAHVHDQAEDETEGGRHSIVLVVLGLAAAVLLIFFGLSKFHELSTRQEESRTGFKVARESAADRFYVLRMEREKQLLVSQEFKDFTVKHSQVGSEIGGFILTEIEDDAISLRDRDGRILRMEVAAWNRDSKSALEREVQTLKQLHQGGQMTNGDLNRLGAIARFGDLTALRVLKRIAAGNNNYSTQANQMLEGSNPEALAILLKQARDFSSGYRKDALQALGSRKTIQGLIVLREIAMATKDPCQAFAIRVLADSGDKESLPVLKELCRHPKITDTVRQAAVDAFEKLTQED
ncbi:HEAT repeat domain-containing protein [Planctomycetota bacterium]